MNRALARRLDDEEREKPGELEDLSHTYPREENARILDWMGIV